MTVVAWLVGASLVIGAPAVVAKESSAEAKHAISAATGQALQGKIRPALAELRSVPPAAFGEKDRAIRDCMIGRFEANSQERPARKIEPLTDRALHLYRSYWQFSLLEPETASLHEERLIGGLRALLGLPTDTTLAQVEAELKQRLAAEGHHVLMGRTPPLMEFIVWASESSEMRQVQLPEGRHSIRVKVLDDFASLGWSAYATCNRNFTGGWVKPDGIYAVRPGWKDLAAENFQVSFLAHETQHFADKKRFGELESWELEYRAKLAELALANVTLPRIVSAFTSNQGSSPLVPHSFANRIVLSWLVGELGLGGPAALAEVPSDVMRRTAKRLLVRDSEARTALSEVGRRPAK